MSAGKAVMPANPGPEVKSHPEYDQHEEVVICKKPGLHAIIAVHNSNLGPAAGGCRIYPYASERLALTDVLRLSRGMTYKSAMADIQFGGGKSVIIADPAKDKTEAMLLAMGEFIDSLEGRYIAAEDSGTTVADIRVMAQRTRFVSGMNDSEQHQGDPSPCTATGVFRGIEEAVRHRLGSGLVGIKVAIQGAGNVGFHLAALLKQAGAEVLVADVNQQRVAMVTESLGVASCAPDQVLGSEVDVLAPCALGAIINKQSVQSIRAAIVAGAANNQLATEDLGEALRQRGILYAPDYVINAGGIIDIYYQHIGVRDAARIDEHLNVIRRNLARIFIESEAQERATNLIADDMARLRFLQTQRQHAMA